MKFRPTVWHLFVWMTVALLLLGTRATAYHAAPLRVVLVSLVVLAVNATSLSGLFLLLLVSRRDCMTLAPGHRVLYGDGFGTVAIQLLILYTLVLGVIHEPMAPSPAAGDDLLFVAVAFIYGAVAAYYAFVANAMAELRWKVAGGCASVGMMGTAAWSALYGAHGLDLWPWLVSASPIWAIFPLIMVVAIGVASAVDALEGAKRDVLHFCGIGVVCCRAILGILFFAKGITQ
jgi:hypothetical protein